VLYLIVTHVMAHITSEFCQTTMVRHCIHLISRSLINTQWSKSVSLVLNASTIQTPENLLSEIAESLGLKRSSKATTVGNALAFKNSGGVQGSPLILALDEIDFLIKNERMVETDSILSTIFRWASDSSYRMILIGISNSVGNECAKRLHKLIKFEDEIIFEPYTEQDMTAIVKKRLGRNKSLVENVAITYLSKKVAKDNGDARSVLEIMSSAVMECNSTITEEQLNEIEYCSPVVKLKHVMKTLRESGRTPYAAIISNLPQSQKVVLCIAMTLSQVSPSWSVITFSQLRRYCGNATHRNILTCLSVDGLMSIVKSLEDAGLLKVGEGNNVFSHFNGDNVYNCPLRLGAQLEDVECALGEALLQQEFYKSLCNHVRKNDAENMMS